MTFIGPPPQLTTSQRDALPSGSHNKGTVIFNTTTNQLEVNIGTDSVPVWSGPATAAQGTTLPTTNLYNGYTFLRDFNDGGTHYLWQFVYRADLDPTYPWWFTGGASLQKSGSGGLSDTGTNHSITLMTYVMPSIPGIWDFDARFSSVSGSQTNAPGATLSYIGTGTIGTFSTVNSSAQPAGGTQRGPSVSRKTIAGGETLTITLTGNPQAGESHNGSGMLIVTPVRVSA